MRSGSPSTGGAGAGAVRGGKGPKSFLRKLCVSVAHSPGRAVIIGFRQMFSVLLERPACQGE